jgi:hypothetical protein
MLLGLLLTNVHITFGGLTLYQFTQCCRAADSDIQRISRTDLGRPSGTGDGPSRGEKARCHGAMLSVPNMENSWIDTKFEICHDISECVSSMLFELFLFFATQPSSKRIGPSGSIIMFWRSCWPKHHKPVLVYHTSQMVGV